MRLPGFLTASRSPDPAAAGSGADDTVATARTRARRRLVGALVLLAAAVVGFTLLFETQPRPLSDGARFEAARRSTVPSPSPPAAAPELQPGPGPTSVAPPAASPPGAAAPMTPGTLDPPVVAAVPDFGAIELLPPPAAPSTAALPSSAAATSAAPSAQVAPAAPSREEPSAEAARARALLEGASAPDGAGAARFVVQVGAFGDAGALREARQRVERLGLRTYTQVVENDAGKRTRVRVGPFTSRDDAVAAGAKLKAAGMPANILAL